MKKFITNKKIFNKRTILIAILAIAVVIIIVKIVAGSKKTSMPNPNDITAISNSMSEEEISAMISQMVEQRLSEHVSEMEPIAVEAETVAPITVVLSTENTNPEMPFTGICYYNSNEYPIRIAEDKYQAAFQSFFLESDRAFTIYLGVDATEISVATCLEGEDHIMNNLSEFTSIEFSSDDNVSSFSFIVPDNPFSEDGKYYSRTNFCAVFRITTDNGDYFTAITF